MGGPEAAVRDAQNSDGSSLPDRNGRPCARGPPAHIAPRDSFVSGRPSSEDGRLPLHVVAMCRPRPPGVPRQQGRAVPAIPRRDGGPARRARAGDQLHRAVEHRLHERPALRAPRPRPPGARRGRQAAPPVPPPPPRGHRRLFVPAPRSSKGSCASCATQPATRTTTTKMTTMTIADPSSRPGAPVVSGARHAPVLCDRSAAAMHRSRGSVGSFGW